MHALRLSPELNRLATCPNMLPHPGRKRLLAQIAIRQFEHLDDTVRIVRLEIPPIERHKQLDRNECCSVVSINKGVITGEAISIRSSKSGYIVFTISGQVLGSMQSRLKQALITHTAIPTIFDNCSSCTARKTWASRHTHPGGRPVNAPTREAPGDDAS